jgi:hypothetical protein
VDDAGIEATRERVVRFSERQPPFRAAGAAFPIVVVTTPAMPVQVKVP